MTWFNYNKIFLNIIIKLDNIFKFPKLFHLDLFFMKNSKNYGIKYQIIRPNPPQTLTYIIDLGVEHTSWSLCDRIKIAICLSNAIFTWWPCAIDDYQIPIQSPNINNLITDSELSHDFGIFYNNNLLFYSKFITWNHPPFYGSSHEFYRRVLLSCLFSYMHK